MIPIGDDNTAIKNIPILTYIFILLNVLVFIFELMFGEPFILKWSFNPSRFLANPWANISTILTSMFMHAGLAHLIGNMLYLWIFGDNVEDYLGKIRFFLLYFFCGVIATFAQLVFNPASNLPHLGASGAIGGVLGAYIYLFPKGTINVLFGHGVTRMSALFVIGLWFLLQFIGSFGTIGTTGESGETGGVAFMAHIGGFLSGLLMALVFHKTETSK